MRRNANAASDVSAPSKHGCLGCEQGRLSSSGATWCIVLAERVCGQAPQRVVCLTPLLGRVSDPLQLVLGSRKTHHDALRQVGLRNDDSAQAFQHLDHSCVIGYW